MVETTWMDETVLRSEVTTFTLAPGEVEVSLENLLDEGVRPQAREDTLRVVRKARVGQLSDCGAFVRCRVFRVLDVECTEAPNAKKIELRSYSLLALFDLDESGRATKIA
jgi:hypothetical protein